MSSTGIEGPEVSSGLTGGENLPVVAGSGLHGFLLDDDYVYVNEASRFLAKVTDPQQLALFDESSPWSHFVRLPDTSHMPPGTAIELRGDEHVIATVFVSYSAAEAGAVTHVRSALGGRVVLSYAAEEAGANETRTRQLVARKMDRVWALQDGWRGPGSLAPTKTARELYLTAVQVLPGRCLAAAQPTPTADGGIYMEWSSGRYDYSAEVTGEGELILNVFAPNGSDDSERVIEQPTVDDLVNFICRGV
ncbi:hypothetical protein A5636_01730 [Mycobacterium asiaticum]|uniref:Uncharacterized protein n=1 Tax=Mycobacterium asiaticum TaxID=1790 RepID=A0A1A3MVZ0_MYCAS|nr:hypothetical protein A5636_01730 [Mycobacterium asiaticum]